MKKCTNADKYKDLSNRTHQITHSSVILNDEQRKEIEEKIVEDLYKIFTHQAV